MRIPVALSLVGVVVAVLVAGNVARSEPEISQGVAELAAARVEIAERMLKVADLMLESPPRPGERLPHEKNAEFLVRWSCLLMEAQLDLKQTTEERVAVVTDHIDRLEQRHGLLSGLHEAGGIVSLEPIALLEYRILEAKATLIRLLAERE